MQTWEPICWRVARRYAAEAGKPMPQETATEFAAGFFKRHSGLHKFAPSKVVDKASGGGGAHPEARQAGNEIQLFPKFWQLDPATRDFVFAHELGHYVQGQKLSGKAFLDACEKHGIDPWDSSKLPFGQFNMDEAFADSFATYHLNRSELKSRYPQWDALVHGTVG